jgi:quercetin dioxygenase-like cupin family protein
MYSFAEASDTIKVTEAQFLRLPKGKVQDWHNPARRQYVVILSGRAEVELTNGKKILLDPGRIVLFEDVTSKGHITRSIGAEDLNLFVVPLAVQ